MTNYLFQALAFISLISCVDHKKWHGNYLYEASHGENFSGDTVVVDYSLVVNDTSCALQITGFQVAESILCKVKSSADELKVIFLSYQNGLTKNAYGVEVYPDNGVLFKLNLIDGKLMTTWMDLVPDESFQKLGHYFVRSL